MLRKSLLFAVVCGAGFVSAAISPAPEVKAAPAAEPVVTSLVEGAIFENVGQASGIKIFYAKCSELPKVSYSVTLESVKGVLVVENKGVKDKRDSATYLAAQNVFSNFLRIKQNVSVLFVHPSLGQSFVVQVTFGVKDADVRIYGTGDKISNSALKFVKTFANNLPVGQIAAITVGALTVGALTVGCFDLAFYGVDSTRRRYRAKINKARMALDDMYFSEMLSGPLHKQVEWILSRRYSFWKIKDLVEQIRLSAGDINPIAKVFDRFRAKTRAHCMYANASDSANRLRDEIHQLDVDLERAREDVNSGGRLQAPAAYRSICNLERRRKSLNVDVNRFRLNEEALTLANNEYDVALDEVKRKIDEAMSRLSDNPDVRAAADDAWSRSFPASLPHTLISTPLFLRYLKDYTFGGDKQKLLNLYAAQRLLAADCLGFDFLLYLAAAAVLTQEYPELNTPQ